MHAGVWEQHLLCYRLRSARSRKRALKKDFEKQLFRLHKEERQIRDTIWDLPWIPLEQPYQKGWKRSFVLRHDVKQSRYAAFFEELLKKINTVEYSTDKTFSRKKRRRGRKYRETRPQYLREFCEHEWNNPRCKLTDAEKQLFYKKEYWDKSGKPYFRFTFSEPWRYVLQVRPNMITSKKMIDEELLSRERQLENYITTHQLRHKIERLTRGRKRNRK